MPPTTSKIKDLMFSELRRGMPGITPEYGECLAQAASICLEDQRHKSGVHLHVDGNFIRKFCLIWGPTSDQMRNCWGDFEFATEQGAYGIAALLVPTLTGLTFFERSRKGTGIDYWLGSDGDMLFQTKARLEVSGIRKGNESEIRARLVLLYFKEQNDSQSIGVVFRNLTTDQIKDFDVPLPSLDVQRRIVEEIEVERKLVEANRKLIEIYERKIQTKLAEIWGERKID